MQLAEEQKHLKGQGIFSGNIGLVYQNLDQYEKALSYYEQALEIRRKIGDVQGEGSDLNNMGYALLSAGQAQQAEPKLLQSIEVYESIRGKVKSGQERSGFQSTLPSVYENLASTRLALDKQEGAFEALERGRAKSFLDLLGTREKGIDKQDKKAEIVRMEKKLASLRDKKVSLVSKPAGSKTRSVRAAVEEKISELDKKRLGLIEEIRRADPELGALTVVDPPKLEEIQSLLGPDVALIEYFHPGEYTVSGKDYNKLWLFVVHKNELEFQKVEVERADLKQALNKYARLIEDPETDLKSVQSLSSELSSWLVDPLDSILKKINPKTLVIVPGGPMYKIPFATLASAGDKALGTKYNLVKSPSAGVYRFIADKRSSDKKSCYALGNPKTAMTPLPGAEDEAREIAGLFKDSRMHLRDKATESRVKSGYKALGSPDVVHLACHGIFNEKAPELSHMALTPDGQNDGKLEMHEIFNLDWEGVSLVTLSACSSGKGKLGSGNDLIGLTRGFMFAGAPSVLCSLWDVDDEATQALMTRFYKNYLNGMDKPTALRKAQAYMMHSDKWSHPYYWSAFVLFGDWV